MELPLLVIALSHLMCQQEQLLLRRSVSDKTELGAADITQTSWTKSRRSSATIRSNNRGTILSREIINWRVVAGVRLLSLALVQW